MSHSQKGLYDTEELFDSDDDANYANFLCIKDNVRPETSTQMSSSQKVFYFQPSTSKPASVPAASVPAASVPAASAEVSLHATKETPSITDVLKTLDTQSNMMRVLLREVKLLRRELREERQNKKTGDSDQVLETLEIPASSKVEFLNLENEIKDKLKEKILVCYLQNNFF